MRLNLSSQIVLNKVPVEFYKPKTTVEYSEISRMEKIRTDIFASMAEGASHVADGIAAGIKAAQHDGKFYVMALGTGSSLTAVYEELIRRYQEKTLSFRNVVVFNAYEYYPLQQESSLRTINQLKERFLSHVDVQEQNIFSLDGFVAQDAVQDCCRLYEQRIKTFGGLDVALIGIGRSVDDPSYPHWQYFSRRDGKQRADQGDPASMLTHHGYCHLAFCQSNLPYCLGRGKG